jgi:hypothetical protein
MLRTSANRIGLVFALATAMLVGSGGCKHQNAGAESAVTQQNAVPLQSPFVWPGSYSIAVTQTGYGDPTTFTYAVAGLKARNDVVSKGDSHSVTIFRLDRGTVISIDYFANNNTVVRETPAPPGISVSNPFDASGAWERVSDDVINGTASIKYKVTKNPARPDSFLNVWLKKDDGSPLQMTNAGGKIKRTFTDYRIGPQAPGLFEIPPGASQFEIHDGAHNRP